MSTFAARLRNIGRVDFDELSASFFRFARQFIKECRPSRVRNAFCQTRMVCHLVRVKILYANDTKAIDDRSRMLMGKVLAPPFGTLMHPSHHFTFLAMPSGALFCFGESTLRFGESFLLCMEEARIVNLFLIGERSKCLESNVHANSLGIIG